MHPRMNFISAGSLYNDCLDRRQVNIVPACTVYLHRHYTWELLPRGPHSYSTDKNSAYSDVKGTQRLKKKKQRNREIRMHQLLPLKRSSGIPPVTITYLTFRVCACACFLS